MEGGGRHVGLRVSHVRASFFLQRPLKIAPGRAPPVPSQASGTPFMHYYPNKIIIILTTHR